jgi:hypothetical protein
MDHQKKHNNNNYDHHAHHEHENEEHNHGQSLVQEFMCHFPNAVFSVLFSLIGLSVLTFVGAGKEESTLACVWDQLFHSFHYMHIVFAGVGTILTFFSRSKNVLTGLIVGFISPTFFCVLSDIIFPYIGGRMIGVHMKLHVCFAYELLNVLPFSLIGILTGLILSTHSEYSRSQFSRWSHFMHILVSSMASSFYMTAHGFTEWSSKIGAVFLLLIIAVVIPCTLSDAIVPLVVARFGNKTLPTKK